MVYTQLCYWPFVQCVRLYAILNIGCHCIKWEFELTICRNDFRSLAGRRAGDNPENRESKVFLPELHLVIRRRAMAGASYEGVQETSRTALSPLLALQEQEEVQFTEAYIAHSRPGTLNPRNDITV